LATAWFIVRVVPKPSRASYPCQRAAFPIASAFVLWLIVTIGSVRFLRKSREAFTSAKYRRAVGYGFVAVFLFGFTMVTGLKRFATASNPDNMEIPVVKTFHEDILNTLPATVGIVQSEKATATDLNYQDIEDLVREAIQLAGGMEEIISDGQTVMLKPNLVNDKDRPIEVNGVTTDYRVIQAVANIVRELNPTGKIILAEGSGDKIPTLTNMERLKYTSVSNIDEFIGFEEASGGYREYDSELLSSLDLPDSLSLYPDNLKPNNARTIYFNKAYFTADVLISIPVLKNHQNAGITGGVKNVALGATPANIYGNKDFTRPFLRSQEIDHDNGNLELWIHDYYAGRPVDFVVVDGLQGVSSGPGGANLSKNQHNMRLILAGNDAIATDAISGLIMGHDPQIAPYLVYLHNHRFGIVDPALIEVKGIQVHEVREDFGFDNNYVTQTKFDKFVSSDYNISCSINSDELSCNVSDPSDLARIQIWVDGQRLNQFVVGEFNNIQLSLQGVEVSNGMVEVLFEDRYLNVLKKQFQADNITTIESIESFTGLRVFPNPATDYINMSMTIDQPQSIRVKIYDLKGNNVFTRELNASGGAFEYQLPVDNLATGQYMLSVTKVNGTAERAFHKHLL